MNRALEELKKYGFEFDNIWDNGFQISYTFLEIGKSTNDRILIITKLDTEWLVLGCWNDGSMKSCTIPYDVIKTAFEVIQQMEFVKDENGRLLQI